MRSRVAAGRRVTGHRCVGTACTSAVGSSESKALEVEVGVLVDRSERTAGEVASARSAFSAEAADSLEGKTTTSRSSLIHSTPRGRLVEKDEMYLRKVRTEKVRPAASGKNLLPPRHAREHFVGGQLKVCRASQPVTTNCSALASERTSVNGWPSK